MRNFLTLSLIAAFFLSCNNESSPDPQLIIDQSIKSHGMDQLNNSNISFTFRKRNYTVNRASQKYVFTRVSNDSTSEIKDYLINSSDLSREVNGEMVSLADKEIIKVSEAINSVLYFFQLPFGLNDQAVNKSYVGLDEVKGSNYHLISVTFKQEGGGTDFQDQYLYWINQETNLIDYLAYNYVVNGGGVRFREAINRRTVKGFTFQDYTNYKPASKDTPLKELSALFSNGELTELSRIINEDIKVKKL